MSSLIEWKSAAQMIDLIKSQNAMVSGMSVAEAAAALGFTKTASGIYVKTVITTGVESIAGATAGSVATGATVGATTTAGNLVLFEGAGGTATVGGIGSLAAPIALSVAAGVGGYLVGNELYEHNSEFLDKLMFPIYDFFTGNNVADTLYTNDSSPTIPTIFDEWGNTYMDSRLTAKVKELLDIEYAKLPATVQPKSDGSNVPSPLNYNYYVGYDSYDSDYKNMWHYKSYFLSDKPLYYYGDGRLWDGRPRDDSLKNSGVDGANFGNRRYLLDVSERFGTVNIGVTSMSYLSTYPYYVSTTGRFIGVADSWFSNIPYFKDYESLMYYLAHGVLQNPGDMLHAPAGGDTGIGSVSKNLIKYTPGTSPVAPIIFPDEVPQWVPVRAPDAPIVPDTMPEPKEFPDPSPSPEKITPYINPVQPQPANVPIKKPGPGYIPPFPIIPVPNPTPNTSTNPSPSSDPSKDPSQATKPDPSTPEVPVKLPDPVDKGTTPAITLPIIPPVASSAAGLLHVYNPNNAQLNQFGAWLWTTFSGDLIDTISKLFNNPMDAVIGLHEIYCTPIRTGEGTIKAGFLDSGVASQLVGTRYTEIHCGALSVPEYWNNYLDYAPYTKTYCYLPFIGIVELDANDIIGSGVEITYKIDLYNGSCIAIITTAKSASAESVTYQFPGNCSVEIPITSGMKSAMQGALLGAATTALAAGTGGGALLGKAVSSVAAGATTGAARGGANAQNTVQHSGSFGSSYGAMGAKVPFIIVKRPKQKVVPGYNENYGYPAHKMVHIAECSGYLRAIEVDVVSPTATEDEKKLIQQLLKSGIFVN